MRPKLALALVALAAGIAACGNADEAEPLATVGPPTKTAPVRSPPSDPDRSCGSQGIDTTRLREGTCTEDTTQYVVVNRDGALRLESLTATVDRISVAREAGGEAAAAGGAFLRFTLTVRNPLEYAQRFEVGQTILGVGEDTFREAIEAERADAGALATRSEGRVEAGGTLRGDVLFDVPVETAEQVASSGRLFVANFGERPGERRPPTPEERREQELASAIGGTIAGPTTQLGQVRLYAGPAAASR